MRIIPSLALAALAASAQVADYANSGYKTPEGRARVAGTLTAHDREQTQRPRELVAAMKLKPGMAVADVGTGAGYMLPFLAEATGPGGKLWAEDIFPDFLDKARANAKAKNLNVTFVQGTDRDPKLPENTLDAILVLDVYHHFDYPAEMLAGIKKALKADGRLVVVDFYKKGFRDPKHIRIDQVDLAKEVESNGFRLLSTGPFTTGRQYLSIFHKAEFEPKASLEWRDVRKATIEGQGWKELKHPFDRLPAKAEGVVRPPVWSLGQNSAGIAARFVTDATEIHLKWSVRRKMLALPHMPATGVSGLDLYVRAANGGWRWLSTGFPQEASLSEKTVAGLTPGRREYMVYFPLYNGLDTLEIGLPVGAAFEPAPVRPQKAPIVFYGTSILQGGCASRPGMAYPAIIGRKLDWPTINLGFSGNGKTEPEVASLLHELKPSVYVLDSLPNLSPDETAARVPPFYRTLRASHPQTPIVLVENVEYTDAPFVASRKKKYEEANGHLAAFYAKLKAEGDRNVYYVKASDLLGDDGEGTVDGTHPTDIGFARMADGVGRVLQPLLTAGR